MKIFVTLFSGTMRSAKLKLGTHVDNGWMYCVYHSHAAAAYLSRYYAPNFEEVDKACWFRVVHSSVHSSRTVHAKVLKFHIWIPHGKIANTRFFFLSKLSPFLELCPLKKSK